MGASYSKLLPGTAKRIEIWPVDRLKPYENNARVHPPEQVTRIAASMLEFGFTKPILVDTHDGIIAGHGALLAAVSIGLADVPVIVLDHLTDAQRRAYILADNKLPELAGWDEALLASELLALRDNGFDLDLTGFDEEELAELLEDVDPEDIEPGEGENPAESSEARIVVRCLPLDKDDVINTILRALGQSGIEGVRVD